MKRLQRAALVLACLGSILVCGCGGGITGVTINVVSETGILSMDESQPNAVPPVLSTLNFTATVGADTSNKGVTWESSAHPLTGTGCAGDGTGTGQCGTLTNITPFSVTYTAPSNLAVAITVTITAQSNAESSVTMPVTINVVLPPTFVTTSVAPNSTTGGTNCNQTNIPPCVLPQGANGQPYNQPISITGGVTPFKFAITSGSLPACLKLNSILTSTSTSTTATINQTACGSRTGTTVSSFTVTVTDSGGAPPVSLAFQITITAPPPLTLITAPLPLGTVDGNYSASVAGNTSGGVSPLSWTFTNPAVVPAGGIPGLPPGLVPNTSTGQITGIPTDQSHAIPPVTYPQTYYFNVQVQDSALPAPGQIAPAQPALFSITIQSPPPLSITTQGPNLTTGITAMGYSASLQATGGIPAQPLTGLPPYTWTVIQGQLPAGLILSSNSNGTGGITGVPVLVSSTPPTPFTVQVSDSRVDPITGNPAPDTATATFTIPVTAGNLNNALIKGTYSFFFNGFDTDGSVAIVGQITADGNGNITAGMQDSNRISGVASGSAPATITGTYVMDANGDGHGTMELITTYGQNAPLTTDYDLVVDSGGNIRYFENYSTKTNGNFNDPKQTHGEGVLKPVAASSFAANNFNGNYAFEFPGFDLAGKPAALAGVIQPDGSRTIVSGTGDFNDAGSYNSQFSLSGDFSLATGNRGAVAMTFALGNAPQVTLNFVFYFVSSSDLFFVECDSTSTTSTCGVGTPTNYRLSGEMILQQPTTVFNQTVLQGVSVATGSGINTGGNASVYAGLLTAPLCDGHTGVTLTTDQNSGGAIGTPSFSGTCTITLNGRTAFSLTGAGNPPPASRVAVGYLTGPGQGFLLGSDAAVTTGLLEQQSGGPFANPLVAGGYTLSAPLPAENNVKNVLGQVTADGSGNISGTVDEIDPTGATAPNLDKPLTAILTGLASNGRGAFTPTGTVPPGFPASSILYVVSPGSFLLVSSDPTDANPQLMFFNH